MTTEFSARSSSSARTSAPAAWIGVVLLAAVLVIGLLWSKWLPYWDYVGEAEGATAWPGSDVFDSVGTAITLDAAWDFTGAYFSAVWKALLVAVVVAAIIDSMIPRDWMTRLMNRASSVKQASMGAVVSLPTMMCSCCAAPVAAGLKRRGVSTQAALAYWVGNPLLNPVVLIFLALLMPWEWTAVRIAAALVLAVGASALIGRWVSGRAELTPPASPEPQSVGELPARFVRSFVRFVLILIPGHLMLVFVIGLFSPLFSGLHGMEAQLGAAAIVLAAAVGTLLVIPTGGEIPVVLALIAAGAGLGMAGALLVTLPALSVPSVALVIKELGKRATAAMAAAVLATGVLGGLVLMVVG